MNIYVARQPIFNRQLTVHGYDLQYASAYQNWSATPDDDRVTAAEVVNSFVSTDVDTLSRGKKAFINFSRPLLDQGAALLLPATTLVVEISRSAAIDNSAVDACATLKALGYQLALADFTLQDWPAELVELADIFKVDFGKTGLEKQQLVINLAKNNRKKTVANNIETRENYQTAVVMGYDFFQGFFFCKPDTNSSKIIPENKLQHLLLLKEFHRSEINFARIEMLIKQDPALSYKLLKHMNSLVFNFQLPISSIRQAITLLGQKNLIQWAALMSLRSIGGELPGELIVTAVTRAYHCETLATRAFHQSESDSLFLAGLFSFLDVFLGRPMETVLQKIPLAPGIKELLLGESNSLSPILDLVIAHERADWQRVKKISTELAISQGELLDAYLDAVKQANLITAYH